jgi:intracellular septation protein A
LPRPSTAAHDLTTSGPRGDKAGALRGVATLLVDLALPVALFYALRARGVDPLAALLISGAPPALRVAVTFARTRRLDAIGALVAVAVVLSVVSSLIEGDPRTLLIRNAVLGFPFALWMFASLNARRPLTYESAKALLPGKEHAFERAWAAEPSFRRVWRRLAVLWGCALLLQSSANVVMAYTLPVDAVPGLDTGLWIAMFVALQIITQIALHRVGAMRMVFAA